MDNYCYHRGTRRLAAGLLVGLLVIGSLGCEDEGQTVVRRNNLGTEGPEESFDRILRRLRRRLERGPRQSVSPGLSESANETSTFSFQDKISGELIEPEEEDEPYRAIIVIETHSNYIFTHTRPDTQTTQDSDTNGSLLSLLDEGGEGTAGDDALLTPEDGLGIDDSGTPFLGGHGPKPAADQPAEGRTETIEADPYEAKKKYDLVYQDDQWVLETELEPKSSVERAFSYALEGQ